MSHPFSAYPVHVSSDDPDLWIPPRGSTACRRPPMKGARTFRTAFVDPVTRREKLAESKLESDVRDVALADRRIAAVHDQPTVIRYRDHAGRPQRHYLDFLFVLRSGVRIGVLVKPFAKAERDGLERLARVFDEKAADVAERFVVMTERHVPRTRVADAKLILRARRHSCPEARAALETVATLLRGDLTIRSLVAAAGLPAGRGFVAAVALLDVGTLVKVGTTPINPDTVVRRAGRPNGGQGGRD
ncbi:hypothetical protein NPA30_05060 [Aurantimonas sp. CSK15Z-1]|uniref:hypothetical protein n=1 Tax=Mangrovibrevibacter kandeliae TaxID=2968473 RepID=UPI0021185330|nr:hypothetical protein [Aurantimonas sp. MSK8Z-1]MCQ8781557.1 hypothetical protein [Aurantimonas sp. CSK15Z-1]